ncbi:MAG: SDR family NAD(P)-dependent oxidoreductase [Planctomycetota bacterium]|nr:MAG: SDR family NAD(P)-dependent oxidoreductase [Planctomycetota bacterium]
MQGFADRTAIVTGAASGIGRALAEALARAGASVVLADLDAAGAAAVAARLVGEGLRARAAALDVASAPAVRELVEDTAKSAGRLDYLFNNAGVGLVGEAHELAPAEWERVLDVNLRGVLHGVLAAYPLMVRQGWGHIVNTASLAGLAPSPHLTAYAASKHAVVGLSTSLRAEARAHGVRVSVACPGYVRTGIVERTRMVNADRARAAAEVAWLGLSPEACARAILRGIRRNRGVIVVGGHARLVAALARWAPWLAELLAARLAARYRRVVRREPNGGGDR